MKNCAVRIHTRSGFVSGLKSCLFPFLLLCSVGLHADPLPDNSRILILGSEAEVHAGALQTLIERESPPSGITVEFFETNDLLAAYYGGTFLDNDLTQTLDLAYDMIVIHPSEIGIRIWPEAHMEAVARIQSYLKRRSIGSQLLTLFPAVDKEIPYNYYYSALLPLGDDFENVKERSYRIGDALGLEVIPAGYTWREVRQDAGLTAGESGIAAPNAHALNVHAVSTFITLFDAPPSTGGQTGLEGVSGAEYAAIVGHALQEWTDANDPTAVHYTGDYQYGAHTPFEVPFDVTRRRRINGRSTETQTLLSMDRIYKYQGINVRPHDVKTDRYGAWSGDFDFSIERNGIFASYDAITFGVTYIENYILPDDPGGDVRLISMHYKGGPAGALSMDPSSEYAYIGFHPNVRAVPNVMAVGRMNHDLTTRFGTRHEDGHMYETATLFQAAQIYTIMSGGANPLEGMVEGMDIYTGPERYVLAQGYKIIKELGGLARVDIPPVATAEPRYFLDKNESFELELRGADFDDLPIITEIVTAPEHGTLSPAGDGVHFTYTPDTDYTGYDYVTYRVTNGTEASHPLTLFLSVGRYEMPALGPNIVFMEDFDDADIVNWETGNTSYSFVSGGMAYDGVTPFPFDGVASLKMDGPNSLTKAIDTTGFENLSLSLRMGTSSGSRTIFLSSYPEMYVEFFDGETWTELTEFTNTLAHVHILEDVQVPLPSEAAMNPEFELRIRFPRGGFQYYVDSIILSGDIVPLAPEVGDLSFLSHMDAPVSFELTGTDPNVSDVLEYHISTPANGQISGSGSVFTFTPDPGFEGTEILTYTAFDGQLSSEPANLTFEFRDNTPSEVDVGANQTLVLDGEAAWTPVQIMPTAWYDAADATTVVESDGRVIEWRDKSGHGQHATQTNVFQQPTYLAADPHSDDRPSISVESSNNQTGLRTPTIRAKNAYAVTRYSTWGDNSFDNGATLLGGPEGGYGVSGSIYRSFLSSSFNDQATYKNGATGSSNTVLPLLLDILTFQSSTARIQSFALVFS